MEHRIDLNSPTLKSYATEKMLMKKLESYGLADYDDLRYIVCRTAEGRWTAVFLVSQYANKRGGYAGIASQFGFMSV